MISFAWRPLDIFLKNVQKMKISKIFKFTVFTIFFLFKSMKSTKNPQNSILCTLLHNLHTKHRKRQQLFELAYKLKYYALLFFGEYICYEEIYLMVYKNFLSQHEVKCLERLVLKGEIKYYDSSGIIDQKQAILAKKSKTRSQCHWPWSLCPKSPSARGLVACLPDRLLFKST